MMLHWRRKHANPTRKTSTNASGVCSRSPEQSVSMAAATTAAWASSGNAALCTRSATRRVALCPSPTALHCSSAASTATVNPNHPLCPHIAKVAAANSRSLKMPSACSCTIPVQGKRCTACATSAPMCTPS